MSLYVCNSLIHRTRADLIIHHVLTVIALKLIMEKKL